MEGGQCMEAKQRRGDGEEVGRSSKVRKGSTGG